MLLLGRLRQVLLTHLTHYPGTPQDNLKISPLKSTERLFLDINKKTKLNEIFFVKKKRSLRFYKTFYHVWSCSAFFEIGHSQSLCVL